MKTYVCDVCKTNRSDEGTVFDSARESYRA